MTQTAQNRQSKGAKLTKTEADAAVGLARVSHISHGLSQGNVVRETSPNVYGQAQADSEGNIGGGLSFVFHVEDANNYSICRAGTSRHLPFQSHGHAGGFGTKLYLSQGLAAALTVTKPTSGFIVYCAYIVDDDTIGWEPGFVAVEE